MHASLLALYSLGGWLVARGALPLRVLLSAIGFTFSLVFATQGCVQSFSDLQRATASLSRQGVRRICCMLVRRVTAAFQCVAEAAGWMHVRLVASMSTHSGSGEV